MSKEDLKENNSKVLNDESLEKVSGGEAVVRFKSASGPDDSIIEDAPEAWPLKDGPKFR